MTHIFSQGKDFAFIHIPKNGGSTIYTNFLQFDDFGQKFQTPGVHPVLGDIHFGHVPLKELSEHYPEEFGFLSKTNSFAITRNPVQRFESALAQRSRQFLNEDFHMLSATERQARVDQVVDHLSAGGSTLMPDFCHFSRQVDYTHMDGKQVVKTIQPLEQISAIVDSLSTLTNHSVGGEPAANQFETTRGGAAGQIIRQIWSAVSRILPTSIVSLLRNNLRGLVVRQGVKITAPELSLPRVANFLRSHYADDFKLYESSRAAAGMA